MELEPREIIVSVQLPDKKWGYCLLDVTCPLFCEGKKFVELPPENCGLTTLNQEEVNVASKDDKGHIEVMIKKERLLEGHCLPLTEIWKQNAGKKFGRYLS